MTVKQVNKELKPIQSWETQPGGSLYFHNSDLQLRPAVVIEKVCAIYKRVRPIVLFVGGFWLVPKKWRETIQQFSTVMDTLCPGT